LQEKGQPHPAESLRLYIVFLFARKGCFPGGVISEIHTAPVRSIENHVFGLHQTQPNFVFFMESPNLPGLSYFTSIQSASCGGFV
jgi:hypothetical protein